MYRSYDDVRSSAFFMQIFLKIRGMNRAKDYSAIPLSWYAKERRSTHLPITNDAQCPEKEYVWIELDTLIQNHSIYVRLPLHICVLLSHKYIKLDVIQWVTKQGMNKSTKLHAHLSKLYIVSCLPIRKLKNICRICRLIWI